jgi:four helix bundle protein
MYKFEKLEIWQLSLEYSDIIYELADQLPKREEFNLKSQIIRATTSASLNIAEGSTGQTDPEQNRFIGMAIRSLIETVACQHLIKRRGYIENPKIEEAYKFSEKLFAKLNAFRRALLKT